MTGIVFWMDNSEALAALKDTVQLEYTYIKYSHIVNQRGDYNWTYLDEKLNATAARGHQAIIRFHDTYPGETDISIPSYIYNSAGYLKTIAKVEGQNTFIPDWSNAELQSFILDFYRELARRYDADNRIAFIQVGFGSYAEYHLFEGPYNPGYTFPDKGFQANFFIMMKGNFSQTPWSVSIDAAESEYSVLADNAQLRNQAFGLFDDSFMHKNHSESDGEYNRASWLFFGTNRWHTSPAGGEFNYYSDFDQRHVLDYPKGPYGINFEAFARRYAISYMIGNDQYEYQTPARIKAASLATGYAFRITEYATSTTQLKVTVTNDGIAPIYYDAYLTINGERAAQSLKGLLPGQGLTSYFSKPAETPRLTIESDRLVNGQTIEFNADLP